MADKEWIHDFFGGKEDFYGNYWVSHIPDATRTDEEVRLILRLLRPKPRTHILDWCGGWGRHAVRLAEFGFKVTLLDFCPEYIERAKIEASRRAVMLNTVTCDFRKTPSRIKADYAINMFTAGIGYFGEEDDVKALKALRRALKPGAKFLLDTMNLFWIARNFREVSFQFLDNRTKTFVQKREFNFQTNHIFGHAVLEDPKGNVEAQSFLDHRIYSPAELMRVLQKAGFEPIELYGGLDGSPFNFDSKRIVIISRRR